MTRFFAINLCLLAVGLVGGCETGGPYVGTHAYVRPHTNVLGQQVFEVRVDQVDADGQLVHELIPPTDLLLDANPEAVFVATTTLDGHHVVDAIASFELAPTSAFAAVAETPVD